jgi:SAM-dependent methyltransferase
MNRGLFEEAAESCPLCSSREISEKYLIESYDLPFYIFSCSHCGFLFMNPRFNEKAVRDFYNEDYYSGKGNYSYHDERESEKHSSSVWDARIKNIRKYKKSGNFLDIGSSFGGLLKSAGRYFNPYGIEISPYAADHSCQVPGLTIHRGTLEDHPFSHDFFSVISMVELIEHLGDPASAVEECFRLLNRGGLLLIQTANLEGLQARILGDRYAYFMPGHLSYFSLRNLTGLLRGKGFSRIKVYRPVDFGLLPKLLKSRHSFRSISDYRAWLRISRYHLLSKIHLGNFSSTSSMVVYAFK